MKRRWVEGRSRAGLLVLVAAALLYLLTLDNGLRPDELTGGDLITHQYAQVEARPGNAPGYPLYTMGGWLWFHGAGPLLRGLLNPIEILSLYSTLWSLASLLILYLILLRILSPPQLLPFPLVVALLTAFYGTTYFFWYYSITTEQYTSATFQTLLIIWLAFKWDDTRRDSLLLALAFVSGTMLANMITTLFILPPLLGFIFSRPGPRGWFLFDTLRRPRLILAALGLALLPLLSYGYVYIRGVQHPEWRGAGAWPSAWDWFIEFMTIRQGRDELAPGLGLDNLITAEFPGLMVQELTWPIFFGGLIGLACLGRRRAGFLYSTLLIYFVFCWLYRFGNWFQVIIPAYPIFIIGVAAGLHWLEGYLAEADLQRWLPPSKAALGIKGAVILLLGGLLLYRFGLSLPRATQHDLAGDTGLDPGWAILADRPEYPAAVFVAFEERVALQYLRSVWGLGSELVPVAVESPVTPETEVMSYITRQAAALAPQLLQAEGLHPQAAGEQLIALRPEPRRQLPATAQPHSLDFGEEMKILGWELVTPAQAPDPAQGRRPNWQIAFYWQSQIDLETDYTVSVRPLMAGQLIMQGNEPVIQDHPPVWGFYPTSRWEPGELVRDVYAFTLPPGKTPEAVQIVVYRTTATGFENLGEQTINLRERQR